MTRLQPAAVRNRSNSDMTAIEMIMANLQLSPEARMSAILARAAEWDGATAGSTSRYSANREFERARQGSHLYGSVR